MSIFGLALAKKQEVLDKGSGRSGKERVLFEQGTPLRKLKSSFINERSKEIRSRAGASLWEMLATILILSSISAYYLPKANAAREKAYTVVMQNDLRNFVTFQALSAAQNTDMVAALIPLEEADTEDMLTSPGVKLEYLDRVSAHRYRIRATHPGSAHFCTLSVGFEGVAQRIECELKH